MNTVWDRHKNINFSLMGRCFLLLLVLMISLWSLHHYFFVVRPWINNLSFGYPPTSVFLPADPHVYWRFSKFVDWNDIAINVFGPTVFLKILGSSVDLAFLCNTCLILVAVFYFAQSLRRSFILIVALIFSNPLILSQVFYPNKELYMLLSSMFFLAYIGLGEWRLLIAGLLLLPFTKIEYIILSVIWLCLIRLPKKTVGIILVGLVLLLSAFYNHIPGISGKLTVLVASQNFGDLGLTAKLQYLSSEHHLFFLTIIPKVFGAMLEGVIHVVRYPDALSQGFVTCTSSLLMTMMTLLAVWKIRIKHFLPEYVFLALWFIAVATVPFSLHRYLFPCYPFLFSVLLRVRP